MLLLKFYPVFQAHKSKYSPLRGEMPDNYLAIGKLVNWEETSMTHALLMLKTQEAQANF
jgi:hypothetical protein